MKTTLVTGANGYVASWLVKKLLEEGHTVHATVRNPDKTEKHAHLHAMAENSPGTLKFFKADLLEKGAFDEAMQGVEWVFHTASPFTYGIVKDPETVLVKPALEGTENVLNSVNKSKSVQRVVLTSSVVAVYGDAIDAQEIKNGVFTEEHWNTSSSLDHQPYPYSKMLAEKRAWEMAKGQSQWDLVTINPGFVLGPALSKVNLGASASFMRGQGNGDYKMGVPDLTYGVVDVRDVAEAHFQAAQNPKAEGRYITVGDHKTILETGQSLQKKFGKKYPFPNRQLPKFLVWLVGPTQGLARKYVAKNVGFPLRFDNSRSTKDLGLDYRPFDQTVQDHFQQLINDGLV